MSKADRFPDLNDPDLHDRMRAEEVELRKVFTEKPCWLRAAYGLVFGYGAYALVVSLGGAAVAACIH